MTVLTDGVFELDGFPFGGGYAVVIQRDGFDPGNAEWRTQDADNPSDDSVMFGRDLRSGPTWNFALRTKASSGTEAFSALAALAAKWVGGTARAVPGAVSTLRYNLGGRTRLVYGRPRRWSAAVVAVGMKQGLIPVLADFKCVDPFHYDDVLQTINVGILPASTGGLISPLKSPLSTVGGAARTGVISSVGGDAPAPFTAVIRGPITNPYLYGPGFRLGFLMSLAYDQSVTIDTRPWARTILRQDGASLAGTLTRESTPLTDVLLAPGSASLIFGGNDATGTATCSVSWRPTYHSL